MLLVKTHHFVVCGWNPYFSSLSLTNCFLIHSSCGLKPLVLCPSNPHLAAKQILLPSENSPCLISPSTMFLLVRSPWISPFSWLKTAESPPFFREAAAVRVALWQWWGFRSTSHTGPRSILKVRATPKTLWINSGFCLGKSYIYIYTVYIYMIYIYIYNHMCSFFFFHCYVWFPEGKRYNPNNIGWRLPANFLKCFNTIYENSHPETMGYGTFGPSGWTRSHGNWTMEARPSYVLVQPNGAQL